MKRFARAAISAVATVLGLAIAAVLIAWLALMAGHNSPQYATRQVTSFLKGLEHPAAMVKTAEAEIGQIGTSDLAQTPTGTTTTKATEQTGQGSTTVTKTPKQTVPVAAQTDPPTPAPQPTPNPWTTVPLYQPAGGSSQYAAQVAPDLTAMRKGLVPPVQPVIESPALDQLAAERLEQKYGQNRINLTPYVTAIDGVIPGMTWSGEYGTETQDGESLDWGFEFNWATTDIGDLVQHNNGSPIYVGAAVLEGTPPNPEPGIQYYYWDIIFASKK